MKKKVDLKQLGYYWGFILILALSLSAMAIYNKFPLIFNSDTAVYMEAANTGIVRVDRPIAYGLFMLAISGKYSLWLVIIVQSMITAVVIFYFFRLFEDPLDNNHKSQKHFFCFLYVLLISFLMGGGFNASWLMADLFTPLSIMCIAGLLFKKHISYLEIVSLSCLTILSICMHNSNFYICFASCLLLLVCYFFRNFRIRFLASGSSIERIIWVLLLVIVSNMALSTIHYFHGGGFRSSRGGSMFLMANLVEMGIVDQYLSENCEKKAIALCKYKDSLPNNYLWNAKSPIYKTGGWEANEPQYKIMVKDILFTPKYFTEFLFKSTILTLQQLAVFETGEAAVPTIKVNSVMRQLHYNEMFAFSQSRQFKGNLDFYYINYFYQLIVYVCYIIYFLLLTLKKIDAKYWMLAFFILTTILINAWICATFSGVYPRYQSRVAWLLPLPIFLYFSNKESVLSLTKRRKTG